MAELKGYLTVAQTAERLGVSAAQVYVYIERGRLPATRLGGTMLIVRESDVAKFQRPRRGRPRKKRAAKAKARRPKR